MILYNCLSGERSLTFDYIYLNNEIMHILRHKCLWNYHHVVINYKQ